MTKRYEVSFSAGSIEGALKTDSLETARELLQALVLASDDEVVIYDTRGHRIIESSQMQVSS